MATGKELKVRPLQPLQHYIHPVATGKELKVGARAISCAKSMFTVATGKELKDDLLVQLGHAGDETVATGKELKGSQGGALRVAQLLVWQLGKN